MKCKAAITDGMVNFMIDETEAAESAANKVLVKIKATGIGHTDHNSLDFIIRTLVTKKYYLSQLDPAFDDLL